MNHQRKPRDDSPRNDPEQRFARALGGDADAWGELVEEYSTLVLGTALRTGLPADQAEDVVQMVWMALLDRGPHIRDPRSLPKWLAVTSRRIAVRQLQRDRNRTTELDPETEAPEPSAEELLEREERARALRGAFAELPDPCRTLLARLFLDDRTRYRQVARDLDIPVGSIGPTRARCLARLQRLLKRRGFRST